MASVEIVGGTGGITSGAARSAGEGTTGAAEIDGAATVEGETSGSDGSAGSTLGASTGGVSTFFGSGVTEGSRRTGGTVAANVAGPTSTDGARFGTVVPGSSRSIRAGGSVCSGAGCSAVRATGAASGSDAGGDLGRDSVGLPPGP
jgi:hypothetical protein